MNEHYVLTDDAIRSALTPAASVRAPMDLGASIRAAIETTPQQRPSFAARLFAPVARPVRILALAAVIALLALVGVLIALGQRQPTPLNLAVDAPMFRGGPDRTNVVLGPGPSGQPTILWDKGVGGPIANNMPAIVGGVVYVADRQRRRLHVLPPTAGDPGWAIELPNAINTSPAVAGGLVIVAESDGTIVALDQATGANRWTAHTTGTVRSSPAIADGVVYLGDENGFLYAFDLATGDPSWRQPSSRAGDITRSPAVAGGPRIRRSRWRAAQRRRCQDRHRGVADEPLGAGQMPTPAVRDGLVMATSGVGLAGRPRTRSSRLTRRTAKCDRHMAVAVGPGPLCRRLRQGARARRVAGRQRLRRERRIGRGHVLPSAGRSRPVARSARRARSPRASATSRAATARSMPSTRRRARQLWKVEVTGQPGAIAVVGDRVYVATDLGRVIAIGNTP